MCHKNSLRPKDGDLKSRNGEDKVGLKDNREADFVFVLLHPLNKFIHTHGGYSYIPKVTKLFRSQNWADSTGGKGTVSTGQWPREGEEGRV